MLRKELKAIMAEPDFNLQAETQKTLREKLCQRLDMVEFPSSKKAMFKTLVVELINAQDEPSSKRREKILTSKTKEAAKKSTTAAATSNYSAVVKSLLDLGSAIRMGPRLYQGLKEMKDDEERREALTERLQQAGAKWNGKIPTAKDIAKARAEKQKQDDLEGLDTSLIIQGRRSRRARGNVNYTEPFGNEGEPLNGSEEEKQGSDAREQPQEAEQEKQEEVARPEKKMKTYGEEAQLEEKQEDNADDVDDDDDDVDGDDDDDDDFEGDDDSDEDEFE